ncbi:MAG: HAD-IA family hydrolase, partial [Burkholderia sp.]
LLSALKIPGVPRRLLRRKSGFAERLQYTQLRTLSDPEGARYRPFRDITLDALRHAGRSLGLALGAAAEKRLMDEYACLSTYPDTVPALRWLRELPGAPRLAILSNGDSRMLDIAVKSAGMAGQFDRVLSVEMVRAYKPAAAAYRLGTEAFGAAPREILFVSSGCVPIHNLMEDAATAEISRSQVWQWIRSPKGVLDDGRKVTAEMVREYAKVELDKVKHVVAGDTQPYERAATIFESMSTSESFTEFLTLPLYEEI